jgi:hypothetical protein
MCDTVFVKLSHDTFTFFTDDVLFSMLQNYVDIFLFYDQFSCVCITCMITSIYWQYYTGDPIDQYPLLI